MRAFCYLFGHDWLGVGFKFECNRCRLTLKLWKVQ
jgi:hypothetical protein